MAAGCGFCIFLGRRQWRRSAAVTAAGKLVISNLVYLSPLQWGWSLSPGDYVRQHHAPWASSLELLSSRVARASVVLFIFNKITRVPKLFPGMCACSCDRWRHRALLLLTEGASHFNSRPSARLSSNDPRKLIGSAIIDDISIPLILLGGARRAEAWVEKKDRPKWKPLSDGHIGNILMIRQTKWSDTAGRTDTASPQNHCYVQAAWTDNSEWHAKWFVFLIKLIKYVLSVGTIMEPQNQPPQSFGVSLFTRRLLLSSSLITHFKVHLGLLSGRGGEPIPLVLFL